MKLLSIAIPCFNSESYMRHCVDTLLTGGEDVEIIIVDDGSTKDATAQIADEYASKYPTIIKAIHQENGGHGQAVNTGIENATGLYFKVVDSDDWVDVEAYKEVLITLRKLLGGEKTLDMLISNFVYEKEGAKHKKVMQYTSALPKNQMFSWKDVRHFRKGQYILMHSVIYRTQLLRECGLKLPKHTFYVDNLFVYVPMPYVKNMYFLDVDFEERLNYIVSAYGHFDKNDLVDSITKLQKRLGGLDTKRAIEFIMSGNPKDSFSILMRYYDKAYTKALHDREDVASLLNKITCDGVDVKNTRLLF